MGYPSFTLKSSALHASQSLSLDVDSETF